MGSVKVDQLTAEGTLIADVDTRLSEHERDSLLLDALPGAKQDKYHGARVIRYGDQVILRLQITYLGITHPLHKKRIQIPDRWLDVERQARVDGLKPRFIGIYHYQNVTIFVDFDPRTYVTRPLHNSSAHVSTNDLYQALTLGQFERVDANGNRVTAVRHNKFADYLRGNAVPRSRLEVFERFNAGFLDAQELNWRTAVQQMLDAQWKDRGQPEWAGFYLEHRFDSFVRDHGLVTLARFQKEKRKGEFDYDLAFPAGAGIGFYGDLKASTLVRKEAPGNDYANLVRCLEAYGRFWYAVYEHETKKSADHGNHATIAWNEWRRDNGLVKPAKFEPLSYRARFKESVRFVKMFVLEVNQANMDIVLKEFRQGKQQDGSARAIKAMIRKSEIDNHLIYWAVAAGYGQANRLGEVDDLIDTEPLIGDEP